MVFKNFGHTLEIEMGSSTGYPGFKGMQTSDIQLWFKLNEQEWKRCNIRSQVKIQNQLLSCENEEEFLILMDYLEYKYE